MPPTTRIGIQFIICFFYLTPRLSIKRGDVGENVGLLWTANIGWGKKKPASFASFENFVSFVSFIFYNDLLMNI